MHIRTLIGREAKKARDLAIQNNEKYYFSGRPCKRNHTSKRLTKNGVCEECNILMKKQNYLKYKLSHKYKMSVEEYENLLEKQNYTCFICDKEEIHKSFGDKIKRLAVDHCHITGKIRGLLCYQCNIGIGNLKHNPEWLRKAALYCETI